MSASGCSTIVRPGNILTARRYDGIVQQQYVVTDPDFFPTVPPASSLTGYLASGTIQQISSSLRAPYLMQTAVGFERELPLNTTIALTFANSHGLHVLHSEDINAPIPGTGIYPRGRSGLVALMESSGLYNQNHFIVNVNSKVNRDISLQGSYGYSHAMSNTDGLGTFPAKPQSEYGPSATDIHHRVSLAGTIMAPWGMRSTPCSQRIPGRRLRSLPARISMATHCSTTGRRSRPIRTSRASCAPPTASSIPVRRRTRSRFPRNYGRGPGQIMLNMRVGRTFNFGESGTAPGAIPGHRYGLTISMQIRNLTNHNNPGRSSATSPSPAVRPSQSTRRIPATPSSPKAPTTGGWNCRTRFHFLTNGRFRKCLRFNIGFPQIIRNSSGDAVGEVEPSEISLIGRRLLPRGARFGRGSCSIFL